MGSRRVRVGGKRATPGQHRVTLTFSNQQSRPRWDLGNGGEHLSPAPGGGVWGDSGGVGAQGRAKPQRTRWEPEKVCKPARQCTKEGARAGDGAPWPGAGGSRGNQG